jgi:NAD(P)-dependent dehydrogenase (short-subunit alcohol dehydrogenase family)
LKVTVTQTANAIPDFIPLSVALYPVGHSGEPEEAAEAVIRLCSGASSFVTGSSMAVNGGYVAQ